jgi:hypothetical protein
MSDTERTEITKVMMIIREFLSETRNIVKNAEKSQQWLIQFRNTLCYQDLEDNPNKFALKLLAEARGFNDTQRRKQQTRWVRESLAKDGITNPSKQQLQERWMLIYGSEEGLSTATGNDQVPAGDATTSDGDDESTTVSGKNYAEEGGTRKGPLNMTTVRKNGALESGTSSANLRGSARPQKTGAGASIAPLLISPLENRAPSPTVANRSDKKQPVNIGAAAPVPPLGFLDCHNREPQAPSPGASHISGDVMSLAYSGEFGNVRLTQEQYNQLGIRFGNQQKLNRAIDSLSCQIENGEKNPANHYAELVKWASYRDDMEEKEELRASSAPHYETVSEHNARIVRESDAWIHEYCQQQKKNRKAANG